MLNLKFVTIVVAGVLLAACAKEDKQETSEPAGEVEAVDSQAAAEQAAVKSAEAWLAIVDDGKYGESWDEAAGLFKKAVPKGTWVEQLNTSRGSFGAVVERTVQSKMYTTTLPGAPDGEYVVIQFQTEFEHKAGSIETVTPLKDTDGNWRVSGYYIN